MRIVARRVVRALAVVVGASSLGLPLAADDAVRVRLALAVLGLARRLDFELRGVTDRVGRAFTVRGVGRSLRHVLRVRAHLVRGAYAV